MIEEWIDKYIGIPYKKHGRDFSGVDCYGLIYLILKNEYNKVLPSFTNDYEDENSIKDILNENIPLFSSEKTDEPIFGDIVLFNFLNMPQHLGFYVGRGKVLHTLLKSESCIELIRSPRLKGRLNGYYRLN